MLDIPAELKYAASHEWARVEADGTVTIGITQHAQELLGDLVFVELPKVGAVLAKDEQAGVVESVKAASDIYAPFAGEIIAVNDELEASPELANTEPYAGGWFFKMRPATLADVDALLSAADYAKELGA